MENIVIRPKRQGIDLLSVSGHKIHGPKGVGFLYMDERVKIKPLIYGGGQQKGLRSGTENVPGCAGLGAAVKEIYREHEAKVEKLYALKDRLVSGLSKMEGVTVLGLTGRDSAPQIVSAAFEGVRSRGAFACAGRPGRLCVRPVRHARLRIRAFRGRFAASA